MRQCSCILVALLLCHSLRAGVKRPGTREVEAQQSAALFIGVRDFDDPALARVPFALDDAVDLAYEMAIENQPPLIPPRAVALALSDGDPVKAASRNRLKALLAAGATRHRATKAEIIRLLNAKARSIGPEGLLILSFATHGASSHKTQHLLATDSHLMPLAATVTDFEIDDVIWNHGVTRSLILIDACRERLTSDRRAAADPMSKFVWVMRGVEGQVVLAGAPRGGYAYDDAVRMNGVFTETVIDGLRCGAAKDWHHFITAETLYHYVSREVLRWVRKNRNPYARRAVQFTCEAEMRKMPLAICFNRTASASTRHRE